VAVGHEAVEEQRLASRIESLDVRLAERDTELAERDSKLAELVELVAKLTSQIEKLTEQLGQNSKNSHLRSPATGPSQHRAAERQVSIVQVPDASAVGRKAIAARAASCYQPSKSLLVGCIKSMHAARA
jgi:uncharacterized coiled-coil protein SlyX